MKATRQMRRYFMALNICLLLGFCRRCRGLLLFNGAPRYNNRFSHDDFRRRHGFSGFRVIDGYGKTGLDGCHRNRLSGFIDISRGLAETVTYGSCSGFGFDDDGLRTELTDGSHRCDGGGCDDRRLRQSGGCGEERSYTKDGSNGFLHEFFHSLHSMIGMLWRIWGVTRPECVDSLIAARVI